MRGRESKGSLLLDGTNVTSVTTTPTATSFAGWDANSNLSANSFIEGYTTTVTAAGTTTLTVASTQQQYFTGTTTQTVVMPVASTLVLGQQYTIVNNSTGIVTVQSSGANTIQAMAASTMLVLTVILTSGTTAASWSPVYNLQSVAYPLSVPNGGTGAATLTSNGVLLGQGTSAVTATSVGATGQVLMGNTAANPTFSTATYPSTTTANQLLYSFAANTVSGLATVNTAILITNGSGVPAFSAAPLGIAYGGTNVTSVTTTPTVTSFAGWDANKNLSANSHVTGYTTTATAAGTTTLTVGSTQQQYFTGTTTQTVVMPVTSTLVLGQQYTIVNNSTGVVTVRSSGSNTIQAMAATSMLILTVINTSVTDSTGWNMAYFSRLLPVTTVYASSATYTPSAKLQSVLVEVVGGGGGAGGVPAASPGVTYAGGSGGGGGGYSKNTYSVASVSPTISFTVGAGGTGGSSAGGSGGNGGTTTFSSLSATGGNGGGSSTSATSFALGGGSGGTGSGGPLNLMGQQANDLIASFAGGSPGSSAGGGSVYGYGGAFRFPGPTAYSATGYGGGGGGVVNNGASSSTGGAGTPGVVIVTEYLYS